MISCNIGVSMQMPRERGVLPDAGAEETWNSGCGDLVCTDTATDRADSELLGLYHSPFTDFI